MTAFSILQAVAGLRALLTALGGTPAQGSKTSQRKLAEWQRRQKLVVTIPPRERMRRQQRVKRYMRNQSSRLADMPGHIREKMG